MGQWGGMDQPVDRLGRRDDRRQRDDSDDKQSGKVLGAAQTIGVAPGRASPAQRERDPQRDGGQRVGEVVDRIGKQRNGS